MTKDSEPNGSKPPKPTEEIIITADVAVTGSGDVNKLNAVDV
jgi:hypothetical protein